MSAKSKAKDGCPGHARHLYTLPDHRRAPVCVRCGHENPKPLTVEEWDALVGEGFESQHVAQAVKLEEVRRTMVEPDGEES